MTTPKGSWKEHKRFKVDMRHTFRGRSIKRVHLTRSGLLHVVNNHALDVGLQFAQACAIAARKNFYHDDFVNWHALCCCVVVSQGKCGCVNHGYVGGGMWNVFGWWLQECSLFCHFCQLVTSERLTWCFVYQFLCRLYAAYDPRLWHV